MQIANIERLQYFSPDVVGCAQLLARFNKYSFFFTHGEVLSSANSTSAKSFYKCIQPLALKTL